MIFVFATPVNCSGWGSKNALKCVLKYAHVPFRGLTIEECHVEDQPASTFRKTHPRVQKSGNPLLRSEI